MEENKSLHCNEYLKDNPIDSPINDSLERSYFAYHLAKTIRNLKGLKSSYTIGILGKWGSGKTSTIKVALKYLKKLSNNDNARQGDLDKIIKEEEGNFSKSELQIKFPKIFTKRLLLFYCIFIIFCFLTYPIINTSLNTITFKLLEFISITDYCAYTIYGIIISAIKECCLFYFYGLIFFEFYKKYSIINNNNYIEIWFEPWNYTNKELILKNFFNILMKNLSNDNDNKCIENLNKLFIEYTKIIGNIDISPFFNIQTNKDLLDIKTKIKNCLEESSKQIIIVIDDLDRLFPDELLLIFQVIKMLVDFPNIIYILSFDKEIVTNILKENFPTNADDYLKKIIQIEKNLPIIDDTILRKYFIKGIEEIVGNNIDNEQKTNILEFYDYAYKDIYIKNMRDIKMFLNHFMFIYSSIKDENLCLADIISISMIETFENNLYEYIIYNKDVLCSSLGTYNDGTIYIYNNKEIIFNQKSEQLVKFKNIKILQIIFPYLFKQIYTLIKNNQNQNSLISDNSIKYLYENLDEDILNKYSEIEKYRRLANPISFENYFRMDIKTTNINASEIDSLINNIYSPDKFNQILFDLYNKKSDKIVDFINYWDSNYNKKYKDKNHTIQLLINLLSLSKEQKGLIYFLDKNDIFLDISRNLIRVYNDNNPSDLITLDNFYNKIFLKTISFLNNNLYFFIYLIFCQYKFSIKTPPKLESLDPNNTFDKICTYLKNNIDKINIVKNKNAMSILFYLYKYLNLQENVLTWINELLSENNPDKLLRIIITSKNLQSDYLDEYGSTIDFFGKINKENELKYKLLEIFFNDNYKIIKQNEMFIINDDYGNDVCIVEHILNLYYKNGLKQVTHNIRSSRPLSINEQLTRLEQELKKYKTNELKYMIYIDKGESTLIKEFLKTNKRNILIKNSNILNTFMQMFKL